MVINSTVVGSIKKKEVEKKENFKTKFKQTFQIDT